MRNVRNALLTVCLTASLLSGCTLLRKPATWFRAPAGAAVAQASVVEPVIPASQAGLVEPPSWLFNDIACAPSIDRKSGV